MKKSREEIPFEIIKEIELDILIKFREICDRHSIKYSLAYGTLLGAVRHGGFIPWDDDIDVMMLRDEYNNFLKVYERELENTKYKFISMHNNEEYFAPLAKMYNDTTRLFQHYGQVEKVDIGVYIDIFIIDNVPDNVKLQDDMFSVERKYRAKWAKSCRKFFARHKSKNLIRDIGGSILAIPYKIIGYRYYLNKIDEYCSQYQEATNSIAVIMYGEGKVEIMDRAEMMELSKIIFEGEEFTCVRNTYKYLTNIYGDYLKLPPKEERVKTHDNTVVWY